MKKPIRKWITMGNTKTTTIRLGEDMWRMQKIWISVMMKKGMTMNGIKPNKLPHQWTMQRAAIPVVSQPSKLSNSRGSLRWFQKYLSMSQSSQKKNSSTKSHKLSNRGQVFLMTCSQKFRATARQHRQTNLQTLHSNQQHSPMTPSSQITFSTTALRSMFKQVKMLPILKASWLGYPIWTLMNPSLFKPKYPKK